MARSQLPWNRGLLSIKRDQSEGWRPSGWQIVTSDGGGRLFVIMQPGGFDGSHKSGGEQVWVLDVQRKRVIDRLETDVAAFFHRIRQHG